LPVTSNPLFPRRQSSIPSILSSILIHFRSGNIWRLNIYNRSILLKICELTSFLQPNCRTWQVLHDGTGKERNEKSSCSLPSLSAWNS
jgi:hypothetical protein